MYVLRWTIVGPHSSYSCLEHHMFWKVLREARMEPPIQTEYLRSGAATILTYDQRLSVTLRLSRRWSQVPSTNPHIGWCEGCEFFLHTIRDAREHGSAAGQHHITIEFTTDIDVAMEDRIVSNKRSCVSDGPSSICNRHT